MTDNPQYPTPPPDEDRVSVTDSGLVADQAWLTGTNVAGRDLIVHQHLEQPIAAPAGVNQLPADIADFAGRDDVLSQVREWLGQRERGGHRAPLLVAIAGQAGVGKTTLAVHIAHAVASDYPDGQIYVNLRGVEAERLDPAEVLSGFLRAFGVAAGAIPASLAERASLYRALLHGRRALVLLDNAASEQQVRPLLPGSQGCAAIITSRVPLIALEGARLLMLGVLTALQSAELLSGILGSERVAAEPEAAAQLVELCDHLPLALRIAGARLAARPRWPLAHMVALLSDGNKRLRELKAGDLEVRAAFALSYDTLGEHERRAFRRLGLVRGVDFAAWVAAAVLDSDAPSAEDTVERLVDVQLLDSAGFDATGHTRYRFHDLLRSFARERLRAEESDSDIAAALGRMLGAYLALSKRGLYLLSPNSKRDPLASRSVEWRAPGMDIDELMQPTPYAWFLTETQAITAAVGQAFEEQRWDMTWELADPLHYHCRVFALWQPWVATHELALEAARRAGNRRGEAFILRNLGNAYRDQGITRSAMDCYTAGLAIARELNSRLMEAAMLNGAGEVSLDRGRLVEARTYFEEAQTAWADVDDLTGVAYGHTHLGLVYAELRRFDESNVHAEESLRMQEDFRDLSGQGYAQGVIAYLRSQSGDLTGALAGYERCVAIYQELGERIAPANTYVSMASVYRAQGRHDEALRLVHEALPIYTESGSRRRHAIAMIVLSEIESDIGQTEEAVEHLGSALPVLRELDDSLGEARALAALGEAHRAGGDLDQARAAFTDAIELFGVSGSPEIEDARRSLASLPAA